MNSDAEKVNQAKQSFNHILDNQKYANIIKDDKHLSLLLSMADDNGHNKYNNILDIGTGTGYLAFPLAEIFPAASVCGIDIAEKIVGKNNEAVKERGISNLIFKDFDGLKYPFADESFDLIVTRYAFHHFPNIEDAILQMNKLLVKGGKVLISDPLRSEKDDRGIIDAFMQVKKDGHIRFYSLDELDKLFWDNGFKKEKQVITDMKFPFAPQSEYSNIYHKIAERDRLLYDIRNENDVVWVNHINVGNIVFVKM